MTLNKIPSILYLTILIIISCNEEPSPEIKPEIIFNELLIDKNDVFIEEAINIEIRGSEFTSSKATSSDSTVIIEQISETNFKITATEETSSLIEISLSNEHFTKTRSIFLRFHEHGTKSFKIIEGINIKKDSKEKITLLHGEPNVKSGLSDTSDYENWYYLSKGFQVDFCKEKNTASRIILFGLKRNTRYINDTPYKSQIYPYKIGNLGSFSDHNGILMGSVIEEYGHVSQENRKQLSNGTPFILYSYKNIAPELAGSESVNFFFTSDNLDNYTGKTVYQISIE